jgi:hypothetical protein
LFIVNSFNSDRIDRYILTVVCLTLFVFPWREFIPAYGMLSVGRVFGIILAVLLVSRIGVGGIRRPPLFHALFLGFILWSAVTILWSPGLGEVVRDTARMGFAFVTVVALWHIVETRRHFEIVLGSMLAGGVVLLGFVAIDWVLTGISSRRNMMFGFNAAIVGRRLAYCVPIVGYVLARTSRRDLKVLAVVFSLLVGPALIAMAVRQALVTVALGAVVFAVIESYDRGVFADISSANLSRRLTKRTAAISIPVIGLIAAVNWLIYQQLGSDRLEYLFRLEWTLTGRTEVWAIGTGVLLKEGNPLLGIGVGSYNSYIGHMTEVSNQSNSAFFGIGVEMGILGLGLFIATVAAALLTIGLGNQRDLALTLSTASIYVPLAVVADVHQDQLAWVLLVFVLLSARLPKHRL